MSLQAPDVFTVAFHGNGTVISLDIFFNQYGGVGCPYFSTASLSSATEFAFTGWTASTADFTTQGIEILLTVRQLKHLHWNQSSNIREWLFSVLQAPFWTWFCLWPKAFGIIDVGFKSFFSKAFASKIALRCPVPMITLSASCSLKNW